MLYLLKSGPVPFILRLEALDASLSPVMGDVLQQRVRLEEGTGELPFIHSFIPQTCPEQTLCKALD